MSSSSLVTCRQESVKCPSRDVLYLSVQSDGRLYLALQQPQHPGGAVGLRVRVEPHHPVLLADRRVNTPSLNKNLLNIAIASLADICVCITTLSDLYHGDELSLYGSGPGQPNPAGQV